tara:strand:+ start:67 stop:303 length:237 start_codon:yes stop_codon:yes gene_type:complete
MKLKIGMPEVLVLFSLFIFELSFWFSIIAFSIGILGRLFDYVINWNIEQKKVEALNSEITGAADAIRNIFRTDPADEH